MHQGKSPWTPALVARLQALQATKISRSELARALHLTRGQVCGKINRLAGYRYSKLPKPRQEYEPDPVAVLAAAIVLDGGTYEEAMAETGLEWDAVYRAVMAAKERDRKDRRRLEKAEAADASR